LLVLAIALVTACRSNPAPTPAPAPTAQGPIDRELCASFVSSSKDRCGAEQQLAVDWCVALGRLAEAASCVPQSRRAFECAARTSSRCQGAACCSAPLPCADAFVAFDHCAKGYCGGHPGNPDCDWAFRGFASPISFLSPVQPPPAVVPAPYEPDAAFVALLNAGIRKIDDTHYEVKASLVEHVLEDPLLITRTVRIVPNLKNNQQEGFKFYAIRLGSVWTRIGFMNGDTLRAINGFELTSAEKTLDAYKALREAKSLELELMRRGRPVTLWITITK
jgi:hypothetical protein